MTDEEIKARLAEIPQQVVIRSVGISQRTLYNIVRGIAKPSGQTRNRLEAWLAGKPLPQTLADLSKIEADAFAAGMRHAAGVAK